MSIETDAVIVGAGPVGLFQIFELGLLGIRCHVVESLPHVGGQCATLYPDKPIYDIPALPVCGAQELVERLAEQMRPFEPEIHLGEVVERLRRLDDGRFELDTSRGTRLISRTVIIAGGLGSFEPRPLRLPGVERFRDVNLWYRVERRELFRGKRVVVLGGGDSALDWALDLHEIAAGITLVHRREQFRAQPASVARMRALADSGDDFVVHVGRVTGFTDADGRLASLEVTPPDAEPITVELDEALVCYGLSPHLGPIADWGLEVERKHIPVDTATFATSIPGVFAVGDINTYPGKKKLILSGFHEAAMTAYAVQKYLDPDAKQHVLYTTTSSLMHERLGLSGD